MPQLRVGCGPIHIHPETPMKIKEFLSVANVLIDVRANDKASLLVELSRRAATALDLSPDVVAAEIVKRDELGSTGIGKGIAMPHARFREIKKAFGLLARLESPIDFDAIDGQPVDIVFLLLLPASAQLDQLKALAAVARKFRNASLLIKLREAKDAAALFEAATSAEPEC